MKTNALEHLYRQWTIEHISAIIFLIHILQQMLPVKCFLQSIVPVCPSVKLYPHWEYGTRSEFAPDCHIYVFYCRLIWPYLTPLPFACIECCPYNSWRRKNETKVRCDRWKEREERWTKKTTAFPLLIYLLSLLSALCHRKNALEQSSAKLYKAAKHK